MRVRHIHLALFTLWTLLTSPLTTDASTAYYWPAYYPSHPSGLETNKFGDYKSACDSLRKTLYPFQKREYIQTASNQYYCYILDTITNFRDWIGWTTGATLNCPNGHNALYQCNTTAPACPYGTFNSTSNQCVSAADKGQPPQSCPTSSAGGSANELGQFTGNPINFLTGNKFHQETYFHSSQVGAINFLRTYNSADAIWRHSYSDRLVFNSNYILLILSDGKELRYSLTGAPLDGAAARFGALTTSGNGWELITKSRMAYEFDAQGRLERMVLGSGQSHHLSYVSSPTSTQTFVSDEFGNQIDFKVNTTGGLFAFTAPGITMSFSHNSSGRLVKTTKTINGQQAIREYYYEDPRNTLLLTGVTDERGVRYATWAYDAQGRAISSQHAGGADKVTIAYNTDGSSTVTNELGKKSTYRFAVINGSKRITAIEGQPSANCPDSNSTFTYDSRGLLTSKTDNKGHVTTFDYNERGLEISRTEAYGTAEARTITTEWHPTLFLPAVVTEPNRIIRYQYDAQGRQLSRTVDAL